MNPASRLLPALLVVLPLGHCASFAGIPLPRSSPESQGITSEGVRAFIEAANTKVDTMHSFMLLRHGQVVAEGWWKPEAADKPHILHSLSKSFTSTAVGLAVADRKLSIDDPVLKFFPEEAPPQPSEMLKAMRVRDLLTMTTGHQTEAKFTPETPWVKSFLAQPVPFKPGTHFLYNTAGTHMLSAIVTKVTGETVLDYLKPRLFEPLGIENPEWGSSPQGNSYGGWGLKIRTEDIAKFGQLYLQKGRWNDKQLIPAAWVEQVRRASERAGDRSWPMPVFDDYRELLKSEIADFTNTGGRAGGAISAAVFLKEFAGDLPWVHMDIAGTAWAEETRPYQPKGATGVGVRTLAELALDADSWVNVR